MRAVKSALLAVGITALVAQGQESEIVVSATKVPSPSAAVGSSVTVITAEDIARQQNNTVAELFDQVPGVYFSQSGGPGTLSSIYIRGAETEQTLVMVDGIEINDAISPGRAAFLSNIDVINIERVEIIRGSQSSLYGSDAMAGAINIITKKGQGPAGAYFSFEAGSFNTFREAAGVSGSYGNTHYSVGVSRFDTDGISAAGEKYGNTEKDSASHSTVSANLGHRLNKNLALNAFGRYVDSESEFDDGAGPDSDDDDNLTERESVLGALSADIDLLDSRWRQMIRVSGADQDRRSKSDWADTTFESSLLKAEWQNDLYLNDNHILTLGTESEEETGKTDEISEVSSDTFSVFVQDMLTWNNLKAAVGGRWDDREEFGSETTYRLAPVYIFEQSKTRIKGSFGTGFKTPSLYQLYAPATDWGPIGNESLESEESLSWDVGVEQDIADGKAVAGVTYFSTEYQNMIDFDAVEGYVNLAEVDTSGVELSVDVNLTDRLMLKSHYTYLVAEDRETGEQLDRRPENRVYAQLAYSQPGKASVSVDCMYVGDRTDRYYDSSMYGYVDADLQEYFLVNIAGSYDLNKRLELLARVENVLDEDYELNAGYGTRGLSVYGGIRMSL